jgi:putative membrane protein
MQQQVRNRVPELTGILTVVSLALVFGAVLGAVPEELLPRNDGLIAVIPHLNAAISLTAILTILAGVRAIRQGAIRRHRAAMLASTLLFASFLGLYLYRLSLEGTTVFAGPDLIRQFVYLPVLAVHILLAIVCIPFVYYALLLASAYPVPELPETPHPRVGRIAASLWLVSFALGIVVYLMLYILF